MTLRYPLVLNGTTIQELQTVDTVDVGLGNVNNTSDANKPVSTATQTALDLKAPLASPTFTGTVSGITATMVGLGNVTNNAAVANLSGTNTGDQILPTTLPASDVYAWAKAATKPTYTYTEVGAQVAGTYATGTGSASGVNTGDQTSVTGNAGSATSISGGSIGALPYQSDVNTTAMLAVGTTGQVLTSNGAAAPTWATPAAGGVTSVNTRTGAVTLTSSDVGLGNVTNTSDANKPISTATQTALNLKAPLASPTFTGTVTAPTFIGNLTGNATGLSTTLAVASGGTGVTTSTGSGNIVLSTSPTLVTPILGTPTSGTLSSCTVDGTDAVGFRKIPQNSQSAAYTCVLTDSGKHIFHPSTDANARTFTIPANSSVQYPIGTAISFVNMTSQVVSIAITTDIMYLTGTGSTGTRSLAQYGSATAIKITSTTWLISGSGLT